MRNSALGATQRNDAGGRPELKTILDFIHLGETLGGYPHRTTGTLNAESPNHRRTTEEKGRSSRGHGAARGPYRTAFIIVLTLPSRNAPWRSTWSSPPSHSGTRSTWKKLPAISRGQAQRMIPTLLPFTSPLRWDHIILSGDFDWHSGAAKRKIARPLHIRSTREWEK